MINWVIPDTIGSGPYYPVNFRPCLVCFFSSLNFRHSSLITLNTTPVWHHHLIFFILFVDPIPVTHYGKKKRKKRKKKRNREQTEVKERRRRKKRKKKEKKPRTDRSKRKKKKKKKKKSNSQPGEERKEKKKSKVVKSCGWVLFVGRLCVFNYNIAIELWVMKTENS